MKQCLDDANKANDDVSPQIQQLTGAIGQGLSGQQLNQQYSQPQSELSAFDDTSGKKSSCGGITSANAQKLLDDLNKAKQDLTTAQSSAADAAQSAQAALQKSKSDMLDAQGKHEGQDAQNQADLFKAEQQNQADIVSVNEQITALNAKVVAAQNQKMQLLAKQAQDINAMAGVASPQGDTMYCKQKVIDFLSAFYGNSRNGSSQSGPNIVLAQSGQDGGSLRQQELATMSNCLQARILQRNAINAEANAALAEQNANITIATQQIADLTASLKQKVSANASLIATQTSLNSKQDTRFQQAQLMDIQSYLSLTQTSQQKQAIANQDLNRLQQQISMYNAEITENGGMSAVQSLAGKNVTGSIQDVDEKWSDVINAGNTFSNACCDPKVNMLASSQYQADCAQVKKDNANSKDLTGDSTSSSGK
jgi:hypothetical protein